EARLIPVQHVKPFVRRHKNDAIDAAAIALAAMHPGTLSAAVKCEEQQAQAMLFRTRQLFLLQRVQLTNALRAHFAEHGIVFAQTGQNSRTFLELCWEALDRVPRLVGLLARGYMRQIENLEIEIGMLDVKIRRRAQADAETRRLQTMPGIGPQTALAVQAFCPPAQQFRTGRDFAAWLGLVPRQHSTGGHTRLGRVTKMGQRDIRRLLIIGANSVIAASERSGRCADPWLTALLARKPRLVAAVALANRMARRLWAMMRNEKGYEIRAAA
ncbi:MAG: IS110 family transposase, partial [Pseudomonadota bacterium]